MKLQTLLFTCLTTILLTSCAVNTVPADTSYVKDDAEIQSLDDLREGTVMVYNDSDPLNIWVNGKVVRQLETSEYVILNLNDGDHSFEFVNADESKAKTKQAFTVNPKTKILEISTTNTSNILQVRNQLPIEWENFRYVGSK